MEREIEICILHNIRSETSQRNIAQLRLFLCFVITFEITLRQYHCVVRKSVQISSSSESKEVQLRNVADK